MLRAFLAAALLSLAVVAPVAHAADGVTSDDNSPSAKEYAIPLDEARSDAAGGASRSGSDGAPEPFGQGVTVPQRTSPSSSSEPARKSTKKDRSSKTVRSATEPPSSSDAEPARTVSAQPAGGGSDSGSSSGQALAGGAALVILAGGAAGLWARRRQQPVGDPG